VNNSLHNFASILEKISEPRHAAKARNSSSQFRQQSDEPKRFKPVGFNVRDDGEGLANSGNKLAHVVNLANFNDRKAANSSLKKRKSIFGTQFLKNIHIFLSRVGMEGSTVQYIIILSSRL
jgi:hypothetical protein